jgi:hypothetical protein
VFAQEAAFPVLTGPYLGQKLPGMTAEMFAPGIISTELHDDAAPAFSPDGKEVYFRIDYKIDGRYYGTIFCSKEEHGIWTRPEVAPFSGQIFNGGASFSANGRKIYTTVNTASDGSFNMDIAVAERTGTTWSKSKILRALNTRFNELNVFETSDGVLHWSSEKRRNDPTPGFYTSHRVGDALELRQQISVFPDSALVSMIALEAGYALFAMPTAHQDHDLFVSFRTADSWAAPINLGAKVNSEYMEKSGVLSPDGKYLFFVSSRKRDDDNPQKRWNSPLFEGHEPIFRADIYWVDARVIEDLKATVKEK